MVFVTQRVFRLIKVLRRIVPIMAEDLPANMGPMINSRLISIQKGVGIDSAIFAEGYLHSPFDFDHIIYAKKRPKKFLANISNMLYAVFLFV